MKFQKFLNLSKNKSVLKYEYPNILIKITYLFFKYYILIFKYKHKLNKIYLIFPNIIK